MNILVDTNIIIYHTNGDSSLEQILDGNTIFVSDITEMEIFSYPNLSENDDELLRSYFDGLIRLSINDRVKTEAIKIRKKSKIRLLDAIIAATAKVYDLVFICADSDFDRIQDFKYMKYERN
ncbi:MAG: type II toxin-antitoxin system VapC family toxin [Balneolaceae bacterium]|nr:type II toxin-antitoxin system VapC family toxin [Balneolaceae bacterium]